MEFLIEKAVELGATDLHPILGARSIVRDVNEARVSAQIREAAEQCERLDLPRLHSLLPLEKFCAGWLQQIPLFAALERGDYPALTPGIVEEKGILIGPEGGFTEEERVFLASQSFVRPVSLGPPHFARRNGGACRACFF
jgi:16S rRNA (uracil1498-N3)-methyltransferase